MVNHFGGSNFIVHFLQESGCGSVVDRVHMLLLDPTMHLTRDLRNLLVTRQLSPECRVASDQLFEAIRQAIAEMSAVNEDCVHITGVRSTLDVMRYGSHASGTALDGSALDITVIKLGGLSVRYSLRPLAKDSQSAQVVEGLVGIRVVGTEMSVVLTYPLCSSLALPLLQEGQLLERIGVSLAESLHLQERDDCPEESVAPRLHLYSSQDAMEVNVTVNQLDAMEASDLLREFLKNNEFVVPVIIFIKSTLKQFEVHPSQLTPYVATLMIVAFSRYCSHVHPLSSAQYYPYQRDAVESGYLLFSFLSFFSPPPRGQFDPKRMRLVPSHSQGILYDAHTQQQQQQQQEQEQEHLSVSKLPECWWVTDLTRCGHNAAGSCVAIHQCRHLFECILTRLLRDYIGDVLCLPAVGPLGAPVGQLV